MVARRPSTPCSSTPPRLESSVKRSPGARSNVFDMWNPSARVGAADRKAARDAAAARCRGCAFMEGLLIFTLPLQRTRDRKGSLFPSVELALHEPGVAQGIAEDAVHAARTQGHVPLLAAPGHVPPVA